MINNGVHTTEGFLLCNGATLSRTTYADLFAVIGTLYGKGDGINATSKFGTAVFDGGEMATQLELQLQPMKVMH